jgi:mannose-6-phosphate isomerase
VGKKDVKTNELFIPWLNFLPNQSHSISTRSLTLTRRASVAQVQEIQVSTLAFTAAPGGSVAATELRPWGSFTILEEGRGYKIKRIEVKPGHRLSLQMHHHRSEHWIVVAGTAKVTCGGEDIILSSNQSTYVPQCTSHRLENPGVIPLVLIEVQNGEYLGEDDIVRFQDDYSRANA